MSDQHRIDALESRILRVESESRTMLERIGVDTAETRRMVGTPPTPALGEPGSGLCRVVDATQAEVSRLRFDLTQHMREEELQRAAASASRGEARAGRRG
jgi:hypothetical protein